MKVKRKEGVPSSNGACAIGTTNDDSARIMLLSILRVRIHLEPRISGFIDQKEISSNELKN